MSEEEPAVTRFRREPGRTFPVLLLAIALLGAAYLAILIFTPLLRPYRFPIPYAVPIFDVPFVLVAIGVAYLCAERHRLRQDFRSVALGMTLWLAALLALAHILAQPDYPGTPGVNPGVAPYFFFLSYLAGFVGIGLAAHSGDRQFPLTDRARLWSGVGLFCLAVLLVITVIEIRPLLPSLVMKPGRLTPFAIAAAGVTNGLVAIWALWGGLRRGWRKASKEEPDWFAGFLVLAAFIWLLVLAGWLVYPFRYGISWYLAGLARPLGVGVIFVGLLREQVWLYREARARMRDLEGLHTAGQALVTSLDPHQIVETIATKAREVSGADGAVLFRLDPKAQILRAVAHAGRITPEFVSGLELPIDTGLGGLAVAGRRPVWTANLQEDDRVPLPAEIRERVRREGLKAGLTIPLEIKSGEVFGTLSVYFREERQFADTDVQLLSAFGTQVAVAIENARAFDQLAVKARNDAALRDFCQRLLEATGEEEILSDAVRLARNLVQADYVNLFLFDPKADLLRMEAGLGWEPGTVGVITVSPSAESFAGYAFLHREVVQVGDLSQERRFAIPPYLSAHGVRAGLAVPLGVRDQPIGVMGAYYRGPHDFSDEESRVLLSLAQQTALALEKVRLYAELQANLRRLQETQAQLIQADKLTALGTLLSGMAHELNSPLSTILLSVQLLKQRQVLPDPIRRRVEVIEEECERASRIIRDLLAFARRRPAERRRVNLNEVINATLTLQAPDFDLNNIRVVKEFAAALPEIWGDSHQLQQVFLNLFTNATHAMKIAHGRGTLTVRSFPRGSGVAIEVEDDGPGIPPEHLGRVFDPFFTTKGTGEGTGLGLSLSIGIVEAHGGRMKVHNVAGSGARFTVELPIGEGAEPLESSSPELVTAGSGVRTLVVDDEASLRSLLTDLFSGLGHHVESAATGQEAIAKLEGQAYDLVTLDLRLPDIHGKDVWRWILSRSPAQAARVIFVTGDTMSAETQEFLQKAGRPVITKPLSIERIYRVVDEVLRAKPSPARS
ncbi:MAG: GAF domain-containing protein [Candidatus Rokubacteria bacterium]|nr:GAF domain-containing protein [Candidatus Rokubacteria bacterium]